MYKNIIDIRQEFVNFFQKKEHQVVSSSSLIPKNDQTLLFTNSGMNQFKNVLLGIEKPLSKRVVTAQRCMRAGGKHNDLDNVGYTDRHLTFFEMLGNFSFGDYFKNGAIQFAWELLTDVNWFNLSPDRIWVTTHAADLESYDIWKKEVGIPCHRIIKIGDDNNHFCNSTNFWKMGNIGPCGPCSEIFYDLGDGFPGKPPGNMESVGNHRYIELWNLVFMQFDYQEDGRLIELPVLSVDTGMGLERIASVLQGVHSNYLIDVFKNLIIDISQIIKVEKIINNRSLYVIADHIRACVFLIRDGIIPANEGRGYVLRRIIRRALLHGKKLGVSSIFLYKLVTPLVVNMKYVIDISDDQKDFIEQILFYEEKLFKNTLKKGLELLEKELMKLDGKNILSGESAFRLYTTYGLPLELTKNICNERNIRVNQEVFDRIMLEEKKCSQQQSNLFYTNTIVNNVTQCNFISTFVGYEDLSWQSKIVALFQCNEPVNKVCLNKENIMVVLDVTPFYGESGGQVGDCGYLKSKSGIFQVIDTKKYKKTIVHIGVIESGCISIGDQVDARVDPSKRKRICLNHSATHLLHEALLRVLGSHVVQQGSLVNEKYLRFDFSHQSVITESQVNDVENLINQQIWNNLLIKSDFVSIELARNMGALMLPKKKYTQKVVRMLQIGKFSTELCGGTHVKYTGEIGLFMITKVCGVGSGIRRIEAKTQHEALSVAQQKKILVQNILQVMSGDDENLLNKIYKLQSSYKKLEKEVKKFQYDQEIQKSLAFINDIYFIKDVHVLIKEINNINSKVLFNILAHLKNNIKSGIIVLVNVKKDSMTHVVINITKDLIESNRINALDLMHFIIQIFGGKGGGKKNFVQINLNNVKIVSELISKIHIILNNML